MNIRLAKEKDIQKIKHYADELVREHSDNVENVFKDTLNLSTQSIKEFIESEDYLIIVAINDLDEAVGFYLTEILLIRDDVKLCNSKIAYLSMVYVDKEYRQYKLGQALLDYAVNNAIDLKNKGIVDRIEFRIWDYNYKCISLMNKYNINKLYSVYTLE